MLQKSGKRIAMGHGLRTISREFHRLTEWHEDNENDLVIFMDGDTMLCEGVLSKTLSFFKLNPKLGVLTTDNLAMSVDNKSIFQTWYELKFTQRNHHFQSHSLSKRVLTATGRFSIYRASVVLKDEFIRFVEADYLEHWLFGRFRFLMGDDKSTWFYLLKEGYEMLYVPDAKIIAIEGRASEFLKTSLGLMKRWYGNMLRNNMRAIKLGPKVMGGFIWWCIVDQRLTTWTPLVGLVSSMLLGIFVAPYFFIFYMIWVIISRLINIWVYVIEGFHFKVVHIPLLLYGQWAGAFVKLLTMFNLKKQTWKKGGKENAVKESGSRVFSFVQTSVRHLLVAINLLVLIFVCGLLTKTIVVPPLPFIRGGFSVYSLTTGKAEANVSVSITDPVNFGAKPDDELPDDVAINKAIRAASENSPAVVQLPSGRFILEAPIIIDKSNVTISGAGSSATILESRFSSESGDAVILVQGSKGVRLGQLSNNVASGSRLFLWDASKSAKPYYGASEYLWLGSPNTKDFLDQIGSDYWDRKYPLLRQTILPTEEIKHDAVYLSGKMPLDMPSGSEVYAPNLISGVTIKNLGITQAVPGMNPADTIGKYENLAPLYSVDGIRLDWTAGCIIEDVAVSFAGRHPIALENTYGAELRRLDINGAWNKGADGNGYVRFTRAYSCRLEDSSLTDIRHLTFQWSASNNIVSKCKIGADVNFHGGFSHHNLVTGCSITPPSGHPWGKVTRMPDGGGHWAPMDGPGNTVDTVD